jgi:hypothetical protein
MRIINRGREITLGAAVSIVNDCDSTTELRGMVVRLLEELTNEHGEEGALLRPKQLARILAYRFEVMED